MTMLFMDSFDHYGSGDTGDANILDGVWAEWYTRDGAAGDYEGLVVPSFGARTGNVCAFMGRSAVRRKVLPSGKTTLYMGFGIYFPTLPNANGDSWLSLRDTGNTALMSLYVNSDGSLTLANGENIASPIVSSSGPVLTAGTWHHLEFKIVINATTGTIEVRKDGSTTPVINGTGLNTGSTAIAQFAFCQSLSVDKPTYYIDDLVVFDSAGSYNNDFIGDVRVATIFPNADDSFNWTGRWRNKLGNGIGDLFTGTDACISAADSTDFELGSGSFTVETFVRFHATASGTRQIIGKWQTGTGDREWTLELTGDSDTNPNQLRWLVSTDGSAETVVHSWPFEPLLYKWYHIAVVRDTTDSYLFLDGVQLGITRTDSNTYNAGAAALAMGARMSSASAVVAGTGINGAMDEIRITPGVARYTSNFTPTTSKFGRDVGGDASFASVEMLVGFDDETTQDESGSAHTLTERNSADAILTDDGEGGYDAINQPTPRDDTVIEAALLAAYGILTLSANPTATETVTVGSQTYTFVSSLTGADDVLIGADTEATLSNLEAAINGGSGEGTTYGTGTTANTSAYAVTLLDPQLMIVALTAGTAGNSIATTETMANGAFDDTTLNNGADIPSASDFGLSRLPPQTTQVKAIQVMTRAAKTDAGTAELQVTLVGPSAGTDAGATNTLTVDPTYRWDIFEEDPDTAAAITPVTVANGLIRVNRTS